MSLTISSNQKIEILSSLSEDFPEIAESVYAKVNKICLNLQDDFKKLDEKAQSDFVINIIANSNDLISRDLYFITEINNYLNNNTFSIKDCIEQNKSISNHRFFNKDSISNDEWKMTPKSELESLRNSIVSIFDKIVEKQSEITSHQNNCRYYFSKLFYITEQFKEVNKINGKINKFVNQLIEDEKNLNEIYITNCSNLQRLENELYLINIVQEKNNILAKISEFFESYNEIFIEQELLINKVRTFQIYPSDNLLNFPDLIEQFSVLLLSYPPCRNFIISAESFDTPDKEIIILKELEHKLLSNFSKFINESKRLFSNKPGDVKDLNKVAKEMFIAPVKDKLGKDALLIINKLFDTMF